MFLAIRLRASFLCTVTRGKTFKTQVFIFRSTWHFLIKLTKKINKCKFYIASPIYIILKVSRDLFGQFCWGKYWGCHEINWDPRASLLTREVTMHIVWRDSRDNVEGLSYQIEGKTLYTSACFVLVEVKQDKNKNSDWEGWSQANKPYKCLYTI